MCLVKRISICLILHAMLCIVHDNLLEIPIHLYMGFWCCMIMIYIIVVIISKSDLIWFDLDFLINWLLFQIRSIASDLIRFVIFLNDVDLIRTAMIWFCPSLYMCPFNFHWLSKHNATHYHTWHFKVALIDDLWKYIYIF